MKFLLNSAVLTDFGQFDYRSISPDEAQTWYRTGTPVSTVGYPETARTLEQLLQLAEGAIAVARQTITMQPGDQALVFRLAIPPGAPRIDPADKGQIGAHLGAGHWELGLLTRLIVPSTPTNKE